jgi:hypothetical protein
MMEKLIRGILIADWKTGRSRLVVRLPRHLKPFEIPIHLSIKLTIPDYKRIIAEGEIEVPDYKVKEMTIHAL